MAATGRGGAIIEVSGKGANQYRQLADRLRDAERKDLQNALRRRIRERARPIEGELRSAVRRSRLSSPQGGHRHPDNRTFLRERMARAITTSITKRGIRIKVAAAKFDPGSRYSVTLPKYSDATLRRYKRLRHPVFGHKDRPWVEQTGRGWFFPTITRHRADFRRAIFQAMDDIERELFR